MYKLMLIDSGVPAKSSHQLPYTNEHTVESSMFTVQVQLQEKSPSSPNKHVPAPCPSYIEILEKPLS